MKGRKKLADEGDPPAEKWLVAYRNPSSKNPEGTITVRQFFAPGFYEAYDKVLTYSEKTNLKVLWFREKRNCGQYMNHNYPELEGICTWCNRRFGHAEPVPCAQDGCEFEFCTTECMREHSAHRH